MGARGRPRTGHHSWLRMGEPAGATTPATRLRRHGNRLGRESRGRHRAAPGGQPPAPSDWAAASRPNSVPRGVGSGRGTSGATDPSATPSAVDRASIGREPGLGRAVEPIPRRLSLQTNPGADVIRLAYVEGQTLSWLKVKVTSATCGEFCTVPWTVRRVAGICVVRPGTCVSSFCRRVLQNLPRRSFHP